METVKIYEKCNEGKNGYRKLTAEDILKLSASCPAVHDAIYRGAVFSIHDFDFKDNYEYANFDMTFHPNGETGTLCLDDEYIFGIRCNHLAWIIGETEEHWGNNESHHAAVLLIGNNKGTTLFKLMEWSVKETEEPYERSPYNRY